MNIRFETDFERYCQMNTGALRSNFLADELFENGQINLLYTLMDRTIAGGIVPVDQPLFLEPDEQTLGTGYFTDRREVGVINTGETGVINVEGEKYEVNNEDGLYIGLGNEKVSFESKDPANPAFFYMISLPAHRKYPVAPISKSEADVVHMGSSEQANERSLYKYIHPEGVQSCQLVMGMTDIHKGSVWNTMPPHRHLRRSEMYLYFNLENNNVAFHFMGTPDELRNLVVRNREAIISPSWSIHSGAGTSAYSFIWSMGGENQDFTDMDQISLDELK